MTVPTLYCTTRSRLFGVVVACFVLIESDVISQPSKSLTQPEEDRGSLAFRLPVERMKNGLETNAWWGQPLPPRVFWQGRTVWLDSSVIEAVRQRGRRMPPPAFDDEEMSLETYTSLIDDVASDARDRLYSHERGFWTKWVVLLPRPPADIEARQKRAASDYFWLLSKEYADMARNSTALSAEPADIQERLSTIQLSALDEGFPVEAFEKDALFWVYVFDKREEYSKCTIQGSEDGTCISQAFARPLGVRGDVILRPTSHAEEEAASAWKRRYLKRLLRSNVDEAYVLAYCTAWKLPLDTLRAEVKAESQGPARNERDKPAVLKDRDASTLAKHETEVLKYLAAGQETAARILADRYWLDLEKLQEKAKEAKGASRRSQEHQIQGAQELTNWRKIRLRSMIAAGDAEEARKKAQEWGISLDELRDK